MDILSIVSLWPGFSNYAYAQALSGILAFYNPETGQWVDINPIVPAGTIDLLPAGNNAATTICTLTLGAVQGGSGKIRYMLLAREAATDEIHVIRGEVPFLVCRKGVGFTNVLEDDKSPPIHANSTLGGTLTATWTWDVTSGATPFIKVTPSSSFGSLAELSMVLSIDTESSNGVAIVLGTSI